MNIVVDATGASMGGMQAYLRGLFGTWESLFPNDVLSIVATPDVEGHAEDILKRSATFYRTPGTSQFWRIAAQQFYIPRLARRLQADVLFCMVPVVPLSANRTPIVSVAHDFRHLHRPGEFSALKRSYRGILYPRSLQRSKVVIANSYATASEVASVTNGRQQNTRVIYMGTEHPSSVVQPLDHAIAFGHWSNKRPDVSIEIWGELKRRKPNMTTILHVVGVPDDRIPSLQSLAATRMVNDRVVVHPYMPDEEYLPLFKSARLVLMPSTFEGFGMPIVEALAHEIPVVASKGAGLEEAGREHIWYADPTSIGDFADKCQVVLRGSEEMRARDARGREYASTFTWERAARMTRDALSEAIVLR